MTLQASYIVKGCRTPVGKLRGSLSGVRTDDLAAIPIRALLNYFDNLDPLFINDVILGCANQAGEDNRNVARMASLLAGLPFNVPGETINRLCASGMSAVIHAHRSILAGDADLILAGGVEQMTRAPYVLSKSATPFGNDATIFDSSFGWRFINPEMKRLFGTDAMGETAENLADMYQISREDQDSFACWSQNKAYSAVKAGLFKEEIIDVEIKNDKKQNVLFSEDEFIRPDTTIEGLTKLRPVFRKDGSVTAGNTSGINDGAAAMLIASSKALTVHDLTPMARIVSSGIVGVEPRIMGIGPVGASKLALKKAGLSLDNMDVIEINEAFAVQVLACTRLLGLSDTDIRLNPNGGAIALGHPLGMSGTRILLTAALELRRRKKRYALITMCVGVGQGYAVIIENCL
ncbi:MAG: acetyl-CoA C-acyltransferase [Saprospiraceae bacterium]|nr:acetyl-CoA C-acyltransferase [Saprospiraceae bacterium]